MFELRTLTLNSFDGRSYPYHFERGINYIEGLNNTGKTAFVQFIDFMLGHDDKGIAERPWYCGTLKSAELALADDCRLLELYRSLDGVDYEVCFNGVATDVRTLADYVSEVNSILCQNQRSLMDFWQYVGEELTYRTFTLFSFLEEDHVGQLNCFFGKLHEVRYRVKERQLFDYLFARDVSRILALEKDAKRLTEEKEELAIKAEKNKALSKRIDDELATLGVHMSLEEDDIARIEEVLSSFDITSPERLGGSRGISESTFAAATLADQIRALEAMLSERDMEDAENTKRQRLLARLEELIDEKPEYNELVGPTHSLLEDLEESTSMRDAQVQKEVLERKKKQLNRLRKDLKASESVLNPVDADERFRVATLLSDHIKEYKSCDVRERFEGIQRELTDVRKELRKLRMQIDETKIDTISAAITRRYKAACESSAFVRDDFELDGFGVRYVRNGNLIQPYFHQDDVPINYYTGSRARHALLQLSGYLAFLEMLRTRTDCPSLPLLVIDNISAPFDAENVRGIGDVLRSFYSEDENAEIQVFLFENKAPSELGVNPSVYVKLECEGKTGFNPFYCSGGYGEDE